VLGFDPGLVLGLLLGLEPGLVLGLLFGFCTGLPLDLYPLSLLIPLFVGLDFLSFDNSLLLLTPGFRLLNDLSGLFLK